MNAVTLLPDLERFADEAIAAGCYRDHAEVIGAAVSLLQQVERQRAELHASTIAAQVEGDRDGYLTGAEVVARVEAAWRGGRQRRLDHAAEFRVAGGPRRRSGH